ncbi:MAG: hypothetical protein ABFD90_04410 [Phycisphaerales bacterium]
MNDCDVIITFVAFLRKKNGLRDLQVEQWPDKENRVSRDIDAIAGDFAIEHTSIDVLPEQRAASARFMQAIGGIEQDLPCRPAFRLTITIDWNAVCKGQDWPSIRQSLVDWIVSDAPRLDDGHYILDCVRGIPFPLHVQKSTHGSPRVHCRRFAPDDDSLSNRLRVQLDGKANKLAKYHNAGKITVLLIDNDDIALMDRLMLRKAIRTAYPSGNPRGVDQLWFADTSLPSKIKFWDLTFGPEE